MPREDARPLTLDWSEVRPGGSYDADDVAALARVGRATVRAWAKAGKLRALPRLSPRQPLRFLGSELLRLLGDQAGSLNSQTIEEPTKPARGRRTTAGA